MATVLLAEDDRAVAVPLSRALEREGHSVTVCPDGPATLHAALAGGAQLLVLDLRLPGMDGLEVCRRLRAAHSPLPVLMLSPRRDEVDCVVGLDAGADDWVGRPFGLAELLARVRALLRRGGNSQLEASGVRLDTGSRRAWCDGTELHLTNKEFALLQLLLEHAGLVVTRETAAERVWGDPRTAGSKTLDMHVSWLRRKIGDDAAAPRRLVTVRGVGFRFEQG
ncbi:MAG TPA: response regulator transcription factor [Mycobacteriales bacterium]